MEARSPEADQARLAFGRSLASQRASRGLSRADVVKATRLPSLLVGAIEDGDTEKWPERVFLVNALRTYANAVGLPADETVARFEALPGVHGPDAFDPRTLEARRRAQAVTMVWVVAAVVSVLGLGAWLQSLHHLARAIAH